MTEDQLIHPLPGYTGKNGRPRNRRMVTLDALRRIKGWAADVAHLWTVASEVYISPADRKPGDNAYRRPREQHEYPENSPEKWSELARYALAIEVEARDVRLWADEQERLTRERLGA